MSRSNSPGIRFGSVIIALVCSVRVSSLRVGSVSSSGSGRCLPPGRVGVFLRVGSGCYPPSSSCSFFDQLPRFLLLRSDPITSLYFSPIRSAPFYSDPIPLSTPTLSKRPSFLPSLLCAKLQFGSGFLPSSHIRSEPPSDPIRSPAQLSATFPATCLRRSTTFLTNLTILINHNSCQIVITT